MFVERDLNPLRENRGPFIASFKSWWDVGQFIFEEHLEESVPEWLTGYLNYNEIGLSLTDRYYLYEDDGKTISLYAIEVEDYSED